MIKKKQVTIFILILGVILIILGIFFQFAFVESNNQRYVEKECSKQADSDNEDYEEKFENLQYDILFGDKYIYNGKRKNAPSC